MKESVGKEQRLASYLLTYYMLYYLYAPKEEIKNYIQKKNLKNYFKIDEIDESIRDSFPENYLDMDEEHLLILKNLDYPYTFDSELENIFNYVKQKIYLSSHLKVIIPWAVNFAKFKKAFYLLTSRSMTVRLEDYKNLKGEDSKKNNEVNILLGRNLRSLCLISYMDLCNHYQP